MDQSQPIGRNAVIDGWRGISVLMAVIGHLVDYRAREVYPIDALNSLSLFPELVDRRASRAVL